MMTWRELRDRLNALTDEQLDCDLAIHDGQVDEVISGVSDIKFVGNWRDSDLSRFVEGVLDYDHPFIAI